MSWQTNRKSDTIFLAGLISIEQSYQILSLPEAVARENFADISEPPIPPNEQKHK